MNATPINLNAQPVQAPSPGGKQADSSAPDVPFSQVLSSEIAHSRKNDAARKGSEASPKADDLASQAAVPADAKADPAQPVKAGEEVASGRHAARPAEDAAVAPETLLALPINLDAFKPAAPAVGTKPVAAEPASAPDVPAMPVLDARQARAIPLTQARAVPATDAGQHASDAHATHQPDPGLSRKENAKENVQLAEVAGRKTASPEPAPLPPLATTPAAAFASQLAAARQADATKTGEPLAGLMGTPALPAVPHTQLETGLAAADAAASRLAPPVGTTAWGQALGEKMVWMAAGNQQTASLTLNPPDLGPLQVVVNVTNDQATASFFSAQPEVRHALEAAFPRLREMMNDAGIQLGQATVSADTPRQNDTPDRQAQRVLTPFPGTDPAAPAGLPAVPAPVRQAGRGLVDTFA